MAGAEKSTALCFSADEATTTRRGQAHPAIVVAQSRTQVYPAAMTTLGRAAKADTAATHAYDSEGLRELLLQAERSLALRRVYLFGSRARGDAREDSDVDLAFEHESSPAEWAKFVNEARDQSRILLDLDLVDFSSAPAALRDRIEREGKLLRG